MSIHGPRWRIALDTYALDDPRRASFIAGIEKVAPQCALVQVPAIAASLAALGKKGGTLVTAVGAVAADEKQLKSDLTVRDLSRTAVDVELVTLKTLVANHATSAADITGMGFVMLDGGAATRTRPDAPIGIETKIGRAHGKLRVVVHETGTARGHYVAESSPDPVEPNSWTSLPGNRKQRTLVGVSGTKRWVRFAQVRYALQSEWSTPVLVTIP